MSHFSIPAFGQAHLPELSAVSANASESLDLNTATNIFINSLYTHAEFVLKPLPTLQQLPRRFTTQAPINDPEFNDIVSELANMENDFITEEGQIKCKHCNTLPLPISEYILIVDHLKIAHGIHLAVYKGVDAYKQTIITIYTCKEPQCGVGFSDLRDLWEHERLFRHVGNKRIFK